MTVAASSLKPPVVRPVTDLKTRLFCFALEHMGPACVLLRAVAPILVLGKMAIVARYDDVREIFLSDPAFGVPYKRKMDVIMDGKPFFLSMGDTAAYRDSTAAMRSVVRVEDVAAHIIPETLRRARAIVAGAGGRLEVVDQLVRTVAFDVLLDYFGVPPAPDGDVRTWATRLFEFQFADANDDPVLDKEIDSIAPAMRRHVQNAIDARRASGLVKDDVLGRCLLRQAAGDVQFSDDAIRCALIGFVAGGVPQLPMAAPQILEQLLRRPAALTAAANAARTDDDQALAGHVFEALRFDPMARVLQRTVLQDHVLAAGTRRARTLPAGTEIVMVMASAMMDGRRIDRPMTFSPTRPSSAYLHFGCGLHQCFGIHINRIFLPAVLKPLLQTANLRRETGSSGHLRKQGIFAEALAVRFDP